ncbi:hypothetical protein Q9Q95_07500 [Sphingomonas sp. DG1-23]|uniref:sulfotransferase family protein n=1 Tax=Sphingomonas sp. DG1-23 TaxID=3068316 RepID=UPI00273D3207|nr:hypothetical protein [Sphingomonas sp. DG1-23]MDP5278763.1 hypothetical protein [Sphingomonas sp. DG1-23]
MLTPNRHNPTGFWEPAVAVQINARILKASGSSFFDTAICPDTLNDSLDRSQFIDEIAEFLAISRVKDSAQPLVVKDPRISNLLPFWLEAIARAELEPRVVIPVRSPAEVAVSLRKWKGVPLEHSAALWLKYNLLAERGTRHIRRKYVSYAGLLHDWRREVAAIAAALQLPLDLNDDVDKFLDSGLRHSTSHAVPGELRDIAWLGEVERVLQSACDGQGGDQSILDSAYDWICASQASGALPVINTFGTDFGIS